MERLPATIIAGLVAILLAPAGAARAALPADTARVAVTTAIHDALAILHNTSVPVEQRRRELRMLAERNLDLAKMAEGVLGTHWIEMTPTQQQQFVPLFEAFLEAAYLDQIQEYSKLNIEVGSETREGANHARVSATVIQPGEEPTQIDFMLERAARGWLLYDIVVDDIGMVENYRAQFDRVIRNRGLGRLQAELRAKQAKLDALLGQ